MSGAVEGFAAALAYDRDAVAAGQWWRVATGLASHWSIAHVAGDVSAIVALGLAIAHRDGTRVLTAVLAAAFATQVAALALISDAALYRGSSGIAWALGAFVVVQGPRSAAATMLLAAAWCALHPTSAVLPDGVLPDPAMHLAGALAGGACAMLRVSRRARG